MTSMKATLRLGELELEVLEYLWANGEASAKTVHAQMRDTRQNSLNTIQTTLDRLYKKGVLVRRKVAHAFLYRTDQSRTDVLTRKISELADELAGGETRALLAAFVEFTSRLEESKLSELEAMLAAYRKQSGGKS